MSVRTVEPVGFGVETSVAALKKRRSAIGEMLARPLANYYLVLVCVAMLATIGLVMVLSASSVVATFTAGSAYHFVLRHAQFLGFGAAGALLLSRVGELAVKLPAGLRGRWADPDDVQGTTDRVLGVLGWLGMALALLLLGLVLTPFGVESFGNRAWLDIGPIELQPSEFAKLAIVLWSATVFATRQRSLGDNAKLLIPFLPVNVLALGLVVAEKDIGTAVVVAAIILMQLWFVGAPLKVMAGLVGLGLAGITGMVAIEVYVFGRVQHICRVADWANRAFNAGMSVEGCTVSDQPLNAIYALASGGWWGLGLGASRQKWGPLYNGAHTDYVFSVLGEELGLMGTMLVIGLFGVLGYAGLRVAQRSGSLLRRIAAAGVTAWLLIQAAVNIMVALQLLPVAGVPLPFISYGGSALVANLLAVGVLLACARMEPQAAAALAARTRKARVTGVVAKAR